eukprot:m.581367 g.581367  ORF g.581367 m.581367 type:complete len:175 (-) comp57936_c0_seq13:1394-1918(-)
MGCLHMLSRKRDSCEALSTTNACSDSEEEMQARQCIPHPTLDAARRLENGRIRVKILDLRWILPAERHQLGVTQGAHMRFGTHTCYPLKVWKRGWVADRRATDMDGCNSDWHVIFECRALNATIEIVAMNNPEIPNELPNSHRMRSVRVEETSGSSERTRQNVGTCSSEAEATK